MYITVDCKILPKTFMFNYIMINVHENEEKIF